MALREHRESWPSVTHTCPRHRSMRPCAALRARACCCAGASTAAQPTTCNWDAFTHLATARRAFERVIYFNPEYAAQFGLHEAILLHNLRYSVNRNRDKDYRYRFHAMSPVELARICPCRAHDHPGTPAPGQGWRSGEEPFQNPHAPEYALRAGLRSLSDPWDQRPGVR